MTSPILRTPLFCAFENRNSGAENLALGNSTIASLNNRYAIFYNPAGINCDRNICFSSTFRNYYGISGINRITGVTIFSLYNKKFSIGFDTFGNRLYQENRILIGTGFTFIDYVDIGYNINYNSVEIANYGEDNFLSFSVGFLYKITPKFSLGVTFSDIYQTNLTENLENIISNFAVGFSYMPATCFTLFTSISRELQYPVDYKIGLEYNVQDYIITRVGYEDSLDTISFGIGSKFNSLTFNYALRWHTWLASSHAISFEIEI